MSAPSQDRFADFYSRPKSLSRMSLVRGLRTLTQCVVANCKQEGQEGSSSTTVRQIRHVVYINNPATAIRQAGAQILYTLHAPRACTRQRRTKTKKESQAKNSKPKLHTSPTTAPLLNSRNHLQPPPSQKSHPPHSHCTLPSRTSPTHRLLLPAPPPGGPSRARPLSA